MTKSLATVIITILLIVTNDGTVWASTQHTASYFEDHSRRVGYKTVNEAVKEFEMNCSCEVKLPTLMPEIAFTHEFGSLYKENSTNDILQIRFVNRKLKSNNYIIEIRLDKLKYEGKEYTLQNGAKAIYFEDYLFNYLVFEKNGLHYQIGLDKNVPNVDMEKVLLEVANSIS